MFSARCCSLAFTLLLPLAAFGQNVAPETTGAIPDATLLNGAAAAVVSLPDHFTDPDTSGVRLTTPLGNLDVGLYDARTPLTVANFKKYIDNGRYFVTDPTTHEQAASFIHRSVPGFIIQGGGYLGTVNPSAPQTVQVTAVTTYPPVKNEPGISNIRGTMAMAKLDGDPDSATSEWFINLADNSANLDNQNGGFTVFGRVFNSTMSVADAIAALPIYNFGSPFDTLPLRDYTSGLPAPGNLVEISSFTYISPLSFTAVSDHPSIATAAISGTNLLVSGKALGTAKITVTATDIDGAQVSQSFNATVVANPVHLANISTRAVVGTNDAALIGGFIVLGDEPKRVVIRAIGPSLGKDGVTNFLADPTLELHDSSGALIASNDNWQDAANEQEVIDAKIAPTDPKESAILTTLPASSTGIAYTAVVRGAGGTGGIGLVEVYDIGSGPAANAVNISTRSQVQTGDDVLIGGFIIFGDGSQRVLVRALGPSLPLSDVPDPLGDPTLTLYDGQGNQIDFNDNWQDSSEKAEIEATNIPPTDPKESALIQTLVPGNYTAIVRGAAGTTGTGLVEVYALSTP